jgi:hypothetical protein
VESFLCLRLLLFLRAMPCALVWRMLVAAVFVAVAVTVAAATPGRACVTTPANTIVECPSNISLPCNARCAAGYLFENKVQLTTATCTGNASVWTVGLPCRIDGCDHAQCSCDYYSFDDLPVYEHTTLDPMGQLATAPPLTPTSDFATGDISYIAVCLTCLPPVNCSAVPPLYVIPIFPTKIRSIYLTGIRVQNSFAGLVSYAKLSTLWLSKNNLTRLDAFPNVDLPDLTSLVLSQNQITIVSPDYFSHPSLIRLRLVDLSDNFITELPPRAFSQLKLVRFR